MRREPTEIPTARHTVPGENTGRPAQVDAVTADTGTVAASPIEKHPSREGPALQENIEAIKAWEQSLLHQRSSAEHFSDWITSNAARGSVLIAHVVWFASWISVNNGWIPGIAPFDPFPFPFLTMTVSLEAIFLALVVLASQNRLGQQSDKRAHLDLQINLLAEREMTAALRLLSDIAAHLNVEGTVTPAQLRDLVKNTDVHAVAAKIEETPTR